jgi:magnesium chelatase subunit D
VTFPGVMRAPQFPFSAVVGMDDLRLGLVLNAVCPAIGGVLVRGEKGTAKSTSVRALAAVLPEVPVVGGCRFHCDPGQPDPACPDGPHSADAPWLLRPARLEELPVGASEDRLVGSLDLERALTEGVKSFEPGLLAAAHRGVLYVDEVNLLHDHLVDLLLDAAALGTCYVEREGVSVRHAARFLLVGTMNPEEGELRPQLLDRFGLTVQVAAPRDPRERVEVIRRRLSFDADPQRFTARFAAEEARLADRIAAARASLPSVVLPEQMLLRIAAVCTSFEVDGLRADIVTARAATAHAAWRGVSEVQLCDVRVAARLALPHRRRRNPFDAPGLDEQQLEDALNAELPDSDPPHDDPTQPGPAGGTSPQDADPAVELPGDSAEENPAGTAPPAVAADPPTADSAGDSSTSSSDAKTATDADDGPADDGPADAGAAGADSGPAVSAHAIVPATQTFRPARLEVPGTGSGAAGRRSRAITDTGRTTRALAPAGALRRLHLHATVLTAAPWQSERGRAPGGRLLIRTADLREAQREGREGNLVLFVLDSSGSMAARKRMGIVKGAVLSLLLDAYQRRDKVGLITFRDRGAQLVLPPTSSIEAAAARLHLLASGGRTPLTDGLTLAHRTLERERLRDPQRRPLLVVVTDGRHTAGPPPTLAAAALAALGVACVVVDCEAGRVRLGLAQGLAQRLRARHLFLDDLGAPEPLADTVRAARRGDARGRVRGAA